MMSDEFNGSKRLVDNPGPQDQPLEEALGVPFECQHFLELAIGIANAVESFHNSKGAFLGDLSPKDILIHSLDHHTYVVELKFRTAADESGDGKRRFHPREEAYPYISPEQTGRVARVIDYRTDLYSIGIIYYLLLTGDLPFHAADIPGWIHCHVAQVPAFPSGSEIPPIIRDIVLKLLSKEPDERYQTLSGLIFDLNLCLSQLKENGTIEPFFLGQSDRSKKFRLPQKLYGHSRELHALEKAFQRVLDRGEPKFILISGEPGIGKTRLVGELKESIIQEGGFFAGAKPDQYKADMPYSTLASAFAALISELLTYSEEQVNQWRRAFHSALEVNARLIIDLVPQFSYIDASSTPLPKLLPAEEEARFAKACRQFLSVFAQKSHPLVLFFDDLQWADSATLKWLDHLFSNPDFQHVLIIGAYRGSEASRNAALVQLLKNIDFSNSRFTRLHLEPLTQDDLDHLIGDAFYRTDHEIRTVSAQIYKKTAGNPFFTRLFLSNLAQEQVITFSNTQSGWICDLDQLHERKFTDNMVEFMVARLKVQPSITQDILKTAATIGIVSDVATLSALTGLSPTEIHTALATAVEIGLVHRDGEQYQFLHDRIQEAAYSLIPEGKRNSCHLHIGRSLLDCTTESDLSSKVFEILSHFKKAISLLDSEKESIRVAELHLVAARKAKAATAYASALNYAMTGLQLCAKSSEPLHYLLEFSLKLEQAECEYLLGQYKKAEFHCKSLLSFAQNRRDQTQVLLIEISLFEIQGQFERGVESLIQCLKLYDIEISEHPTMNQVLAICEDIWKELGDRKIEDLVELPVIQDPELLIVLRALSHNICSYFTDEKLFLFQGASIVHMSLKHGNSASAVSGYGMVALFLGPMFGKYREAYEFGKLACKLVEVHGFESARAMALDEFGAFVNYWMSPLSTSLPYLRQANEAALKFGQMNWYCYSSFDILTTRLFKGDPLPDVLRESNEFKKRIQGLGNSAIYLLLVFLRAFILNMSELTESFSSLASFALDQTQFEREELEGCPALIQCWYYLFLLQSCVFFGDFTRAESAAEKVEKMLWSTPGQYTYPEYHFFLALTLTNLYRTSSTEKQVESLKTLNLIQEKLHVWTSNNPQNFHHKFALVSAEIARIRVVPQEAMRHYEEAIQSARKDGFSQYESLAYELAGKFYADEGFTFFSASYLSNARTCYRRWGADGKVRQLEQLYPAAFAQGDLSKLPGEFRAWSEDIDLVSVVKASQAISSIIDPEKLVHTLLQVILEQSGGQRVVLFLKEREQKLKIGAEASAFQAHFQLKTGVADQGFEPSRVPQSMVNYVSQTGEYVLLNEPESTAHAGTFSNDPYFSQSKPKSLLCMPVLRQREIIGLIYLENDITPYAFSAERLTVLQLLAAQAAISLQNADLYQDLRNAVQLRDDFLALASHELKTPIVPLKLYLDLLIRQMQNIPLEHSQQIEPICDAIQKTKSRLDEMQKLIDSLFDVSLLTSRGLALKKGVTRLVQLVRNVIQRLEPELRKAGCALDLDAPVEIIGNWDATRVEQVIVNLLTNAMKFGAGKGIRVRVERAGDDAAVSITDQGIGIKKEDQARIFKKFERASSPMKYFGLGLGLYIAHEIVAAHGGVITVESEPDKGSIFAVRLPTSKPLPSNWGGIQQSS